MSSNFGPSDTTYNFNPIQSHLFMIKPGFSTRFFNQIAAFLSLRWATNPARCWHPLQHWGRREVLMNQQISTVIVIFMAISIFNHPRMDGWWHFVALGESYKTFFGKTLRLAELWTFGGFEVSKLGGIWWAWRKPLERPERYRVQQAFRGHQVERNDVPILKGKIVGSKLGDLEYTNHVVRWLLVLLH